MKRMTILGAAAVLLGTACTVWAQQPASSDAKAALDRALAPLKTLNAEQMKAAAALAAAYRAGIEVDMYCPPLKAFSAPPRYACLGEVGSLATAEKDCNDRMNRKRDQACRERKEAEAALVACETKRLMADLNNLGRTPVPPDGLGQPKGPPKGPGPQPTTR